MVELDWQQQNSPYSRQYKDVYYSAQDGLAESRHVFLDGNQLAERFKLLQAGDTFTILETGFGTGLNFLSCLKLWNQLQPRGSLRYVSMEGFALSCEQIARSLDQWRPDLEFEIDWLLGHYQPGRDDRKIWQASKQFSLELLFCRADKLQQTLDTADQFDAFFMDGFSPARNPEMWQSTLCQLLFQHARPGASLATFTVAGMVKRNLSRAGFRIQKIPGFGKKREMLTAYKADS